MNPSYEETYCIQNDNVAKQIRQLQHVVDENRRKLESPTKKAQKADQYITKCNKEISQRVNLLMEYGDVIDDLQALGRLLKLEHNLKEQLNGQSEEDRRVWKDLQDRNESVTIKTQSLTSEIKDVTCQLEEVLYKDAQSPSPGPSSRPKRSRTKQR